MALRLRVWILLCIAPLWGDTPLSTLHHSGEISVVTVMASWCPPCQKSLPTLQTLARNHPNISLYVLYIDENLPAKNAIALPNFHTMHVSIEEARTLGVEQSVPYTVVIDRAGIIVKRYSTLYPTALEHLIVHLEAGEYENGTLPPQERIDLWQKNRYRSTQP